MPAILRLIYSYLGSSLSYYTMVKLPRLFPFIDRRSLPPSIFSQAGVDLTHALVALALVAPVLAILLHRRHRAPTTTSTPTRRITPTKMPLPARRIVLRQSRSPIIGCRFSRLSSSGAASRSGSVWVHPSLASPSVGLRILRRRVFAISKRTTASSLSSTRFVAPTSLAPLSRIALWRPRAPWATRRRTCATR